MQNQYFFRAPWWAGTITNNELILTYGLKQSCAKTPLALDNLNVLI